MQHTPTLGAARQICGADGVATSQADACNALPPPSPACRGAGGSPALQPEEAPACA